MKAMYFEKRRCIMLSESKVFQNRKETIHTRRASAQKPHCGRSCKEPDNQHADNSNVHALKAIVSETEIAP